METVITIIKAVLIILAAALSTGVPLFVKLRTYTKSYRIAKTAVDEAKTAAELATAEAAKEKAKADLLSTAKDFIVAAEVAFDGFDKMMKAQNGSAGAMKKDTVFNKLQAYALQNGYDFDADEWSATIDELVKFTKAVNAKKSA